MSGRLAGKVAVVTGGAGGLGGAIAARLGVDGATVVTADVVDGADVRCDVSDRGQVQALVDDVVAAHGRLDVMVANAGIAGGSSFLELSDDSWQRTLDVNLTGVFLCDQLAARQMVAQGGGGAIVNTGSILSVEGNPLTPAYSAAKAGVLSLTRSASVALGGYAIRVNAVGPGYIDTAMTEGLRADPTVADMIGSLTPLGRFGEPREVADVVAFLASDEASFVTGQILFVDGGWLQHKVPSRDETRDSVRAYHAAEAARAQARSASG